MASNFNLVRKQKKDVNDFDDDEVEDIDFDDSSSSRNRNNDEAKTKMIRLMIIIVVFTVVLLLVLWIASLVGAKQATYEDVEELMKEAAISYFADHKEYLPQADGNIVEVGVENLVAEGKMKDLSTYFGEGACTGTVQVEKAGSEFLYTPYLNCGESYTSVELFKKVVENNPIVKEGSGLYSSDQSYIFRGESVENYVKLDNALWRIVKIVNDGNVVLISNDGIVNSQPWDNRFNEEKNYEAGMNNYSVSRVKEYLKNVYSGNVEFKDEKLLSDKDRSRIVSYDVCIGKRGIESTSKNNSEECRQKDKDQKLGLLTLSDYLYASLDTNCKSAATKSCTNYNYLTIDEEWWLATASNANDYEVFKVDRWGIVQVDTAGTYSQVRPVIYLNSKVMYKDGKGTKKDPYIVK